MIDRLRRAGGGAAADRLEASLQCTQTLFNVAEIGGDGTGMWGSRKHGLLTPREAIAPSIGAVEPGIDLPLGLVLRHAVALLQTAGEF